jgi:hypothetical protein
MVDEALACHVVLARHLCWCCVTLHERDHLFCWLQHPHCPREDDPSLQWIKPWTYARHLSEDIMVIFLLCNIFFALLSARTDQTTHSHYNVSKLAIGRACASIVRLTYRSDVSHTLQPLPCAALTRCQHAAQDLDWQGCCPCQGCKGTQLIVLLVLVSICMPPAVMRMFRWVCLLQLQQDLQPMPYASVSMHCSHIAAHVPPYVCNVNECPVGCHRWPGMEQQARLSGHLAVLQWWSVLLHPAQELPSPASV